jgi:hypothetical protein
MEETQLLLLLLLKKDLILLVGIKNITMYVEL